MKLEYAKVPLTKYASVSDRYSIVFPTDLTNSHLPTVPIILSGTNDKKAKNLSACTGECDDDGQCAHGLKCFHRENGEPIPGCTGKGGGPHWDYCYAPTRKRSLTL